MNKALFDLIVFDWDGTLMDSTAVIGKCIQAAARDLGLAVPPQRAALSVIGLDLRRAIQTILPDVLPEHHAKLTDRYHYHMLAQDQESSLFEGVREMLLDLSQQGYFLAVATGMGRVGLNRALNQTGLLSLFDASRCADETFSKPHPAMLQELGRELGQPLQRTLMVGDTTHDLQMAINAGAASIAVTYGAHPEAALRALQPIHVAANVADLHAWLNTHA